MARIATLQAWVSPSGAAPRRDPAWVRWTLVGTAVGLMGLFLVLPLAAVFAYALEKGVAAYLAAICEPEAWSAIKLTLLAAGFAGPLNLVFGLAASWAVARFDFPGKSLLLTLIDIPFTISPVISGMLFVLLFGAQGWFGRWLTDHDLKIIFAAPGIILATTFVTLPFIARVLIPQLESTGAEEEQAALTLGASGWQMFWRVTLPNLKWALLYGVIQANARAMGEFGAVSVVSGHIRGVTNTLPLYVEILYDDYQLVPAFAVASLLTGLALVTLVVKGVVEWKASREHGGAPELASLEERAA